MLTTRVKTCMARLEEDRRWRSCAWTAAAGSEKNGTIPANDGVLAPTSRRGGGGEVGGAGGSVGLAPGGLGRRLFEGDGGVGHGGQGARLGLGFRVRGREKGERGRELSGGLLIDAGGAAAREQGRRTRRWQRQWRCCRHSEEGES